MTKRPNILFFFTDDQRFNTIHALGNDKIHTPNLDQLASEGVAFTHAHIMGGTSGAVCMPSRAMLMTGRSLFHLKGSGYEIPEEHTMLGEVLREAGYETFGTGKWHSSPQAFTRSFSDGAQIFFGGMNDHWNVPACDYRADGQYPANPQCQNPMKNNKITKRAADHIACGVHSTDLFADATSDFIRRQPGDKPFFAYLAFMAPHDPRNMPQEFLDLYDPDSIPLPENYMPGHPFNNGELKIRDEQLEDWPRTETAVRRHLREYYAMISHVDAAIGRVLDTLRESGDYENTIIVFAGDNGLAVGSHGLMGKQNLYEHSVRVPLMMAGPGIPRNERRDTLCYLIDLFPTLCGLCGLETPDSVEGKDLRPALNDPDVVARDCVHTAYINKQRAVRDQRYKLIEYVVEGMRTTQLFDLQTDPHELCNLADAPEQQERVEQLRGKLRGWQSEWGDTTEFGQTFWAGFDARG